MKKGQPLFVRMLPDGTPGESRDVFWVQLLQTADGLAHGGIVFLPPPKGWVLRRQY